jgi:predicted helicase
MRNELSETFDKIYILDLHGNAKKKETSLDGSKDENVFDIQQGVSINIFIKNQKIGNIKNSNVLNFDLRGLRSIKYEFLNKKKLSDISWNEISPISPNYFFVKKDFHLEEEIKYFKVENLFNHYNSGLTTEFDEFAIQDSYKICEEILRGLKEKSIDEIQKEYLLEVKKIQKIINSKNDILKNEGKIKEILYRPFDKKHTIYTGKSNGLMGRPRYDLMKHFLNPNIGLIIGRQGQAVGSMQWNVITITNTFVDSNVFYRGRGTVFPLYLYPDSDSQLSLDSTVTRTPNLNMEIVKQIAEGLGLKFTAEKRDGFSAAVDRNDRTGEFAPIDLLDYIYAVLHSPTYRETYKEFLKIDFPRVPFPDNVEKFWKLVQLGGELRALHLMESPSLNDYITEYPIGGDNEVEKPQFVIAREDSTSLRGGTTKQSVSEEETASAKSLAVTGKVFINSEQYFDKVPEVAWNFYIGGYQPAQKWLKDRKGRTLEFEDILHYQKIIKALTETDRIMGEIDGVEIVKGGAL